MKSSLAGLQLWLRPYAQQLLDYAAQRGWANVQVTSVRRTKGLQTKLYRAYLNGRSQYPAAPPGHSTHELGLAFDLSARPDQLAALGSVWQKMGGTWGAAFGDPIHFEASPAGRTVRRGKRRKR